MHGILADDPFKIREDALNEPHHELHAGPLDDGGALYEPKLWYIRTRQIVDGKEQWGSFQQGFATEAEAATMQGTLDLQKS